MSSTIQLVEARGTHRQVGQQVGEACRELIRESLKEFETDLPPGITWGDIHYQGALYEAASREVYPQYIEELEGIAEAAGVPFEHIFLSMCEELWETAAWRDPTLRAKKGCSDMAARGKATTDGSTLVAHTNDLLPEAEKSIVLLKIQADHEPEFLGVSPGGVAISAGFNAAGISLTGNQLYNNDIRPGVPRLLVVRAILASTHLPQAMQTCLLPQRASSYNNVIADPDGEVYSMEGSATDCEALYIEEDILAHTNHYLSPAMRRYEADRSILSSSILRYNRAMRLLRENYGTLSPQRFQELLADHAGFPASICKHGPVTATVFSIIIQPERRLAWIGLGRACETVYHEYRLEPYTPVERPA